MIFSNPEQHVVEIFASNEVLIFQEKSLFYLKLPIAVISSLQCAECKGVEQNLAKILSVNHK